MTAIVSRRKVLGGFVGLVAAFDGTPRLFAQESSATPERGPAPADGLAAMLRHVPAELPELESPQDAWIQYADIATQIAAAGVETPEAGDEDAVARWREAVRWLAFPPSIGPFWLSPDI
jgi:hypothetical protein